MLKVVLMSACQQSQRALQVGREMTLEGLCLIFVCGLDLLAGASRPWYSTMI
jgi:hypothetical protein